MKKVLAFLAFTAVMTACNNDSEKKSEDSDVNKTESSQAANTVSEGDTTKAADRAAKK